MTVFFLVTEVFGGRTTSEARKHTRKTVSSNPPEVAPCDFEQLYLESYSLVYGYIRARMASDADAEDIVAEAYMKAARAFDSFDASRAKFSTWVVTIARNCMVSHFRKEHPSMPLDSVTEFDTPSALSTSDSQESLANRDLSLRLLAHLNDNEREVVLLKYQVGMRNVDIARVLNMNASTVSTKLSNALAKMRIQAEKEQ